MNVLFVSTEATPFAKTGGLADVIGSLPQELCKENINACVMLPLYKNIKEVYGSSLIYRGNVYVPLGWRDCYCGIFEMEHDNIKYYFLDNEQYFYRDKYYGYYDDGERFAFYSKAALEVLQHIEFRPDILHCSEWQTGLVPVYLKTLYKGNLFYDRLRTVFTIHNIEYQGQYGKEILGDLLGLSKSDEAILEMDGDINFMKGAIVTCDKLTTVSPTYAGEIRYSFFAYSLETVIQKNEHKISGILNGIDTGFYNPQKDKELSVRYSVNTMKNKRYNKTALQKELGLEINEEVPLIAMVGRLAKHKGISLVMSVYDDIMRKPAQFVLLGSGEKKYEDFFVSKSYDYGNRMAAIIRFSSGLASRIYAAADLFLMPSISEPCGLSQMIALRYGAVPIVRETGGLKDTITPFNPKTGIGNGITFYSINAHDMLYAVRRGQAFYQDKALWNTLMRNTFLSDFSWKKSTLKYIKLYQELLG